MEPALTPGIERETALNMSHLRAEMARIDALLARAVARGQAAGKGTLDPFRGLHVTDAEARALLCPADGRQEPGSVRDARAAFDLAYAQAARRVAQVEQAAYREGVPLRLLRLVENFQLDRFDRDAFLICLAPALDLRYERLYAYLQDDVTCKYPRPDLILTLLADTAAPDRLTALPRFTDQALLFRQGLVQRVAQAGGEQRPLLAQWLRVDDTVTAWLLGSYQPSGEMATRATLVGVQPGSCNLLPPEGEQALARCVDQRELTVFFGPDRDSQQAAARCAASRLGRPLLLADLESEQGDDVAAQARVRQALRDARLTDALPCLDHWDACLAASGRAAARLGAEVCAFTGPVILLARERWQPRGAERTRRVYCVEFPLPAFEQRVALWSHFVGQAQPGEALPDVEPLASQFLLSRGQIRDAVEAARDLEAQRGGPLQQGDLFAAARAHSSPGLMTLARKTVPRYRWCDIVLPDDQLNMLQEIVATVRSRALVFGQWGVGRKLAASEGISILFAGPPGTGKTMAAEVIAAELDLDLYKVDLSTIVSKYIGETEKNLERIFGEAQSSNAILFFDEADAIFGRRSEVKDAHDRYANIEISYLLQRMEAYDGVTILATNLRANLDEAFTRRLQFALDFPFPDETYRGRIWQTLLPPGVPCDPDLDFGLLARRFKLAGGNIRNILVSAAFLAAGDGRCVSMAHLLHGARRELQKMGRLVNEDQVSLGS